MLVVLVRTSTTSITLPEHNCAPTTIGNTKAFYLVTLSDDEV